MKNKLRNIYKTKRSQMDKQEVAAKSAAASLNFLESKTYKNSDTIMLYMPLGNEADTSDIIKQAFLDGKKIVFPVTDRMSGEIEAHLVSEETEFKQGAFSVREPCGEETVNPADIDVVVVPGILFDREGNRIGFGKGCYDKFLRKCRQVKVGFCYEFQVCDRIPAEKHDIKMDFLVTENGIIKC